MGPTILDGSRRPWKLKASARQRPHFFVAAEGICPMPDSEFLERYPLYRTFPYEGKTHLGGIPEPSIHMSCPQCRSGQTFVMVNNWWTGSSWEAPISKEPVRQAIYGCASCQVYERHFLVEFNMEDMWVRKVGQQPPWDISMERDLERALGEEARLYKNGLICESQAYGIGAFSYYRRIVELTIDELLEDIARLIQGAAEQSRYEAALDKVRQTKITEEKIQLVKDLLPPILRPSDLNPLGVLHSALSEGLHAHSDERCMELAEQVRGALEFLVREVAEREAAAQDFTSRMRKLLAEKAPPEPEEGPQGEGDEDDEGGGG